MDQNTGQSLVLDGQDRGLTVFDLKIMGRIVKLEALARFDFHGIISAVLQRTERAPILASRHGVHQGAVCLADLEGGVWDTLGGLVCIDLDDLHTADGGIVKVQRLRIVGVDNNGLCAIFFVDGIARDRLDLCDDHRAGNTGKGDLTLLIRPVQAIGGKCTVLGVHIGAVGIDDLKLNTLQRCLCHGILLDYDEVTLGLVSKFHHHDLVGLDLDRLRGIVEDIAFLGADLFDDECGVRGNTRNDEYTHAVRCKLTVCVADVITAGIGDKELNISDGGLRHSVHFFHQNTAVGVVAELHRDDLIGFDLDRLRGIVEDIAIFGASFLDDECGVGGNIRNGKSTCAVRHIFAVGITDEVSIGVGHEELNIGDRFVRCSVHLFHQNATLRLVTKFQGHHRIVLDFDALRRIIQNVAVFCPHLFCNDRHAGCQTVNTDGACAVGHIFTVGRAEHAAIRIRNKKFNVRNGCAGDGVLFDNEEGTHLIIAEGHGDHVLILAGEIDRFRGVGDHIPVRR